MKTYKESEKLCFKKIDKMYVAVPADRVEATRQQGQALYMFKNGKYVRVI